MKEIEKMLEKIDDKKIDKNVLSKGGLSKKKSLQEKGITLIALVVTIIILLILAGVTLNIVLSDNGLFSKTREAVEKYKQAQREEEEAIRELEKQLGGNKPTVSPSTPTEPIPTEPTPTEPTPKPEELTGPSGKPLPKTIKELTTKNEEIEDSLGNPVVIPKGFKFVGEDGDTVKEGIVIQDNDGNEFVWIPVSNIDGDNDAKTEPNSGNLITIDENQKVEITLGRYSFGGAGTPTLVQKGARCNEDYKDFGIGDYCRESTKFIEINEYEPAKDLQGFVNSVKKNHGYYIGRYEAGKGTENKPISKVGQDVWNSVTQQEASSACQGMYTNNEFTSDLINSYAWDTAIVYIQSMGNSNYANATCKDVNNGNNSGLMKSGLSKDEKCHISDMATNVGEWTTEYKFDENHAFVEVCVERGGFYTNDFYCTESRLTRQKTVKHETIGFRPLLYLN